MLSSIHLFIGQILPSLRCWVVHRKSNLPAFDPPPPTACFIPKELRPCALQCIFGCYLSYISSWSILITAWSCQALSCSAIWNRNFPWGCLAGRLHACTHCTWGRKRWRNSASRRGNVSYLQVFSTTSLFFPYFSVCFSEMFIVFLNWVFFYMDWKECQTYQKFFLRWCFCPLRVLVWICVLHSTAPKLCAQKTMS